jgi:hypothetical protein
MMHKHLVGTQPSNFNVNVKHFMTTGGNLAKKSSAGITRPVRHHVLQSWIQLCKLLRKMLKLLENLLPKPSELILFDEPDTLTESAGKIFCVVYNQLQGCLAELTKLTKGITSSPSRSASTNEGSSDDPLA